MNVACTSLFPQDGIQLDVRKEAKNRPCISTILHMFFDMWPINLE